MEDSETDTEGGPGHAEGYESDPEWMTDDLTQDEVDELKALRETTKPPVFADGSRYKTVSEAELDQLEAATISHNTKIQTKWAVKNMRGRYILTLFFSFFLFFFFQANGARVI